jgi:hypothetical protein
MHNLIIQNMWLTCNNNVEIQAQNTRLKIKTPCAKNNLI